jgi:hypothetical protein
MWTRKTIVMVIVVIGMAVSVEGKPKPKPTHKPTHMPTHNPTHKPTHHPTHKPIPTQNPPAPYGSYTWHDDLATLCLKIITDCRMVDGKFRECMQAEGCPVANVDEGSAGCKGAFGRCEGALLDCILNKNPTYDCSYFISSP